MIQKLQTDSEDEVRKWDKEKIQTFEKKADEENE